MNIGARLCLASGLAALLVACASTPSGPYWEDQRWNESLFIALQESLSYPIGANEQRTDPVSGKVGFTYDRGHLKDVSMIESTGSSVLDAAMVQQVSSANIPLATGPDADQSRRYELVLRMPTPIPDFYKRIHELAAKAAFYPRESVNMGQAGAVVVAFDYEAGHTWNIQVFESSGYAALDKAALLDVKNLQISPPVEHEHDRMHLRMQICYSLRPQDMAKCPTYKQVIEVTNKP